MVIVFVLSYFRVPFLFFQQDEIMGMGLFIRDGAKVVLTGLGSNAVTHFVPLTLSISYLIFRIFGMKYWIFNLVGLSFHLINGLLVYQISKRIFKKEILAIISVLVFFSFSGASELIMWPVVNINSVALTFSLVIWLILIDGKILPMLEGFWRGLVVSSLFLLALFSVEYSAGLILFIPLLVLLRKGESIKDKIKILIPYILVVLAYLFFRFIPFLHSQVPVVNSQSNVLFPIRVFSLVVKYFGQLFLGQSIVLFLSRFVQIFAGLSGMGSAYAENYLSPIISEVAGIALFVISALIYLRLKVKRPVYAKGFLLCVLFIVFSSLPFLLVPEGTGLSPVIASRYLYFGLVGMAIFVTYILDIFVSSKKKRVSYAIAVLVSMLVFFGTITNYKRANQLYLQGILRLKILNSIKSKYSTLPNKVIFYTESDSSYYGLPDEDKILPFQSGFGQTLLVYYSISENFPRDFLPGDYLWDITSQGYKEAGGRGFGYFRNFDMVVKTIQEYRLEKESVIAYKFSSYSNTLTDITQDVRGKIGAKMIKSK